MTILSLVTALEMETLASALGALLERPEEDAARNAAYLGLGDTGFRRSVPEPSAAVLDCARALLARLTPTAALAA